MGRYVKFGEKGKEHYGIKYQGTVLAFAQDLAIQVQPKKKKKTTKEELCQHLRHTFIDLMINAAKINDKRSALEIARSNILELRHDGIYQADTQEEELRAMTEHIGTLHTTGLYLVAGHYGVIRPAEPAYGFTKINIVDLRKIIGKPQLEKAMIRSNGSLHERMIDARWIPTEDNLCAILCATYPQGFGEITPIHDERPLQSYCVRTVPEDGIKYALDTTDTPELDEKLKILHAQLKTQAQEIMSRAIHI